FTGSAPKIMMLLSSLAESGVNATPGPGVTGRDADASRALPVRWLVLLICLSFAYPDGASGANSIARTWDEQALSAIRADTPHPPAQARNLFSLSVCMYDAWAAYDKVAVGYIYH